MTRKQRLVGGDHVLAGLERGLDAVARRAFVAADQFDQHIDLANPRHVGRVVIPLQAGQVMAAPVLRLRAGRYRRHLNRAATARRDQLAVTRKLVQHTGSHGAQTGNAYAQRFAHVTSLPAASRKRKSRTFHALFGRAFQAAGGGASTETTPIDFYPTLDYSPYHLLRRKRQRAFLSSKSGRMVS
jgi:hypothetical protein